MYLRTNTNIQPAFLKIVYAIALEISIKMNEQMILSLEDIVSLFENKFNIQMLKQLEMHIITLNQFKLSPVTSLDFVLFFLKEHPVLQEQYFDSLDSEKIVDLCIPVLHFCYLNYEIRAAFNMRTIALAVICTVIFDHFED